MASTGHNYEENNLTDKVKLINLERTNGLPKKDDGDFGYCDGENYCELKLNVDSDDVQEEGVFVKSQIDQEIGHRVLAKTNDETLKISNPSQIMESVRMGIQSSIGSLSSQPERDVLMVDFMTVESTPFTSDTATDRNTDFVFKTYAPVAFRHLRDLFGIKPDRYLLSFSQAPLIELANAGASSSVFYLTKDDQFIMKTVMYREAEFLQKLLPGYFLNLSQNPRTLLPKFFGLYCYKRKMTNVRLVAMNNLLPSEIEIHQKYDLKGSTYMRKASKTELQKGSPTYKDLDFARHHPDGIYLKADVYKNVVQTIQRDCRVLESFRIMDYSLLLGIHYVNRDKREMDSACGKPEEENSGVCTGDGTYIPCEAENVHLIDLVITNKNTINPSRGTETPEDTKEKQSKSEQDKYSSAPFHGIPAKTAKGEKLVLFLGIIDILQSYNNIKRVEHFLKSMVHDRNTISVHNPAFYARRFEDFLTQRVFKMCSSSSKAKLKTTQLFNIENTKR